MTKIEHRLQGLEDAYFFLCEAEKRLVGHTENQELRTLVNNLKDKVSETMEKLTESSND